MTMTSTQRRFKQVDVFTDRPFYGNPVAVVIDADGLSSDDMQRIARWTNLSETTFLLQPTQSAADYRVRIFTPGSELTFAGHPTVGTAHAAIEAGVITSKRRLVQECAAGLLDLEVFGSGSARRIAVTAPAAQLTTLADKRFDALADALGARWHGSATPITVDMGPRWLIVQMNDGAAVSALAPDMAKLADFSRAQGITGVTAFGLLGRPGQDLAALKGSSINVRAFAPAEGVAEDPVCGSGNASVGVYISNRPELVHLLPQYIATQGREIGRDGYVTVTMHGGRVQIGGHAVTCIDGTLTTE